MVWDISGWSATGLDCATACFRKNRMMRRGVKPVRNNLFFVWAKCEREFCSYAIFLSKICHTMVGYGYYTYHNNHFLFHSIQVLKNLFDYLLILLLRSSFVAAYRILCFWYIKIFFGLSPASHTGFFVFYLYPQISFFCSSYLCDAPMVFGEFLVLFLWFPCISNHALRLSFCCGSLYQISHIN